MMVQVSNWKNPLETQAPEYLSSGSSLQELQMDGRFSYFTLVLWKDMLRKILAFLSERGQFLNVSLTI